ncbi:Rhodanese domain protein [Allomeiothermus silvanus DSM 9946]|uniref:Rhodanese domain protein n=1 Tax=Allomeiothermus silvanus (strain ATCC 700542 / DSM 9946 / NBRC 106475 / NCIMB 13440 / VI-R2) TaxID=526227 RepID=D7BIG2_ALLS1|nr:rhodanese-like domain-containing protein [Allomeiothermus silvanus]ADH64137.1 Rhodanese domain protein [Allomeiothermus silvanus DSM 9946]
MKSVDAASLPAFLERRPLVVDVRSPVLFRQGSLEGALNIPTADIQQKKHQLPKDRPILLVCERGIQSELAGLYLEADGYAEVYNLAGGLNALKR